MANSSWVWFDDDYGPDSEPTLPILKKDTKNIDSRALGEANGKWLRSQQIGKYLRAQATDIEAIDATWSADDLANYLVLLAERIEAGETLTDDAGRV